MFGLITWGVAGLLAASVGFEAARIWDARIIDGLRVQVAESKAVEIRLTDNVNTCVVNQRGLQISLDEANAAVMNLRASGEAATARAREALERARTISERNRVLGDMIAERLPPPGTDVCTAALDEARRPDR
jgi:hypothetical protein